MISAAVVGGGISGLASAYFLARAGRRVTLFEASEQLGGLGTTFETDGHHFDRFYHVVLPTDDHLLGLARELGLEDRFYWREATLGFLYQKSLYDLAGPLDLLRFRPAAPIDRLRLGLTALYAAHVASPEPLDDITVEQWLTRLSGRRAFDQLWRPLLKAKFGDAYQRIPALWYWASFNREKGTKKEVKGYLRGGYKGIADALLRELETLGVDVRTRSPVAGLSLANGSVSMEIMGESLNFDQVILTVPHLLLPKLLSGDGLAGSLGALDLDLDYQGALNVLVMLRRSVTKHYWVPVVDCDAPFSGIVETTRTLDLADTAGRHMVYLASYLHRSDDLFKEDSNSVKARYVKALIRLFPELEPADVIDSYCFRRPYVEPIWTPGYGKRKPPLELVAGKLFLASTAHVYPEVTSWNSSIGVAQAAVNSMVRNGDTA